MTWSLVLVPLLTGAGVWSAEPLVAGRRRMPARRAAIGAGGATGVAVTLGLAIWASAERPSASVRWSPTLTLHVGLDDTAAVMAVLVPAIALPVVVFAAAHEDRRGLERLVGLLVGFVGAMELLVVAEDLLTLLIGWELVGLLSWALISHRWEHAANPASAAHAFIATRAGDLGLFAALGAAIAGAGSLRYGDLATLDAGWRDVLVAGIVLAATSKSAQVPFSPWLFSAMAGPSAVSALLHSATMVAAGAFLLARLHPILDEAAWFGPVVIAIGLTTALAGGAVALGQRHAKRLLAASTSAQYGLMFVAVGAGAPAAALAHLVSHAAFKALLFLAAGVALGVAGTNDLVRQRLGRVFPAVTAAALVGAAALAALPPLGGAWTKELVAAAAGHESELLAVAVVLAGGLSAAYATVWMLLAYGRDRSAAPAQGEHRPGAVPLRGLRARTPSRFGSLAVARTAGASGAEHATLGVLAAASVALGLLWLPGGRRFAEQALGGDLVEDARWERFASLALLGAGVTAGAVLARRRAADPAVTSRSVLVAEAWLGIPWLVQHAVVDPTLSLARRLARFDEVVVDAGARATATFGSAASGLLARGDDRVVDAGVRATAAAGRLLARLLTSLAEVRVERTVDGLTGAVGRGGALARRLQTGLTHQYYVIAVAGLLALVVVAIAGR